MSRYVIRLVFGAIATMLLARLLTAATGATGSTVGLIASAIVACTRLAFSDMSESDKLQQMRVAAKRSRRALVHQTI